MYIYVYVVSCRVRRPTQTDHGVCTLRGTDRACICFFCHRCVGRCCTNRLHGCIVCECMESLCVYIVVHAHRANAFVRVPGHGTMGMDGWMACVHSCRLSSTREETDGFERRTERDHRHRSHRTRLSRVSLALALSLSNDEFIHSFIHSLIHSVANERTNEGTNERTNDRTRSRGTRERRTRSTRSFASNSARARRGTRVCLERTTHRTHRIARAF